MGKRVNVIATSSTASIATLQTLWGLMLQQCTWYLEHTPAGDIRADYLNVIRSFLRDNGIDADAVHRDDVRKSLAELSDLKLPFGSNPF